ncbi:MAG TPA: hypothetical protein VFK04_17655 [Gemmatimonadaceae bacterium]|nr:hypothetical protein [Gemmatimonadaceae bacterium]
MFVVPGAVAAARPLGMLRRYCRYAVLLILMAGCSDAVSGPRQPAASFELAVSPPVISGRAGATTDTALISLVDADHITGPVTVHVEGLPSGATTSPGLPLSITPGSTQPIVITLPPSAVPESSTVIIRAGSDNETAPSATLALHVLPFARTYRDGNLLILERLAGQDTLRVALDDAWGGSVVEASVNGLNVVNSYDPGREIQVALYDRDQISPLQWNPVQAGDSYGNGSSVVEQRLEPALIYTKTRPLHWYPDRMGGSDSVAVPSDVYLEQWVEPVPDQPTAFHFRYRITHVGSDYHATARQELPAVYTNRDFDNLVYYGGDAPWTGAAVTSASPLSSADSGQFFRTAEHWSSFLNADSIGVTIYAPDSYGYVEAAIHPNGSGGPKGLAFNYLRPLTVFGLSPQSTVESDFYLILGDYRAARHTIYELRARERSRDILAPYLTVDQPRPEQTISGVVTLLGWCFGKSPVTHVSVSVDDGPLHSALYGAQRPDVARIFPGIQPDIGFALELDTRAYANGTHTLHVEAVDATGMAAVRNIEVQIKN